MSIRALIFTSLVCVINASSCSSNSQTLRDVTACPRTEKEWKKRALLLNCSQVQQICTKPSEYTYHCLINAFYQKYVEVCAERQQCLGFCPEYNFRGKGVQNNYDENCRKHPRPCPQIFMSDEVYKYPSCFEVDKAKTNKTQIQTETGRDIEDDTTISIPIVLSLVLTITTVIMIVIWRKRRMVFAKLFG